MTRMAHREAMAQREWAGQTEKPLGNKGLNDDKDSSSSSAAAAVETQEQLFKRIDEAQNAFWPRPNHR